MDYIKKINEDYKNVTDLNIKKIKNIYIIYLESIIDQNKINDYILKIIPKSHIPRDIKELIPSPNIKDVSDYDTLSLYLESGFTIIINKHQVIAVETRGNLSRSISTPNTEGTIYGPKESFVENYQVNLGLIKRRVKSKDLKNKDVYIGRYTKNMASVLYIDSIAEKEIFENVIKKLENIDDLLRNGSLTVNMARFLEAAVMAKLNIVISGGTGTGKTTLLNILSGFLGDDERIITIEDAAELNLHQRHVISLETRLTNYEGEGEVTIRDLVRNSLRMRPDRIIVGEVRGKEAFDMMQAMNTGHEGSLTTLHANNPIDAINRLETMILMNEMEIPVSAVRGYIENAIDIVIQIDRLSDGKRKITSISELAGMEDGNILLKDIFTFKQTGVSGDGNAVGEFRMYKRKPLVYDKIVRKGLELKDMFN